MYSTFNQNDFYDLCDQVAAADADLAGIIKKHGYPPFWSRPNTFESLVHIILEQQVSLASALSALNKLKERVQEIKPARILLLTDEELKTCYFSRQKTAYVKYLAEAILSKRLNLEQLEHLPEDEIRLHLTSIKGIGNWTTDIYLIFILHRSDVFPLGDLAAVQALKSVKNLPVTITKDEMALIAAQWQPHRTIATMLLWHEYLSKRK